jgi:Uncharacterized conserved protein
MKMLQSDAWRGAIALLLGLALVIFPGYVLAYLSMMMGIALLVYGGIAFGVYLSAKKHETTIAFPIDSLFCLLAGVALLAMPQFFINMMMVVFGALLVLGGAWQIWLFCRACRRKIRIGWGFYLLPILVLGAGIVILINPFAVAKSLVVFIGITILCYAIMCFVNATLIKRTL